jgi:peptidoglycan/xylan/chitin deacetylase (PgdA/CDA1 family)
MCAALAAGLVCGCARAEKKTVSVKLDRSAVTVLAGATDTLTATVKSDYGTVKSSWRSDNEAVATVSGGAVTGVSQGTCRVICTADAAKAVCTVTVQPSSRSETVLMYHSIAYEKNNKLRVPAENFDKQMKWLHDNGYTALTPDQLSECLSGKKVFPLKSVMITLDDGYGDNYGNMYPIIKKYGLHATVFMITSKIGADGFLSAAQLKEMSDSGYVSVESHTVTHPYLSDLSYASQLRELTDSKNTLEGILGKKVEYLAYPTGKYNKNSIAAAQAAGYKLCLLMEGGTGSLDTSAYEYPRAFVDSSLNTLIDAVNGLGY